MKKPKRYAGTHLKALRTRLRCNQKQFAQLIGISAPYYSQMESDKRPVSRAVAQFLIDRTDLKYAELETQPSIPPMPFIEPLERAAEQFTKGAGKLRDIRLSAMASLFGAGILVKFANHEEGTHSCGHTVNICPKAPAHEQARQLLIEVARHRYQPLLSDCAKLGAEALNTNFANYFAIAVMMPLQPFREATTKYSRDIDRLSTDFNVSERMVRERMSMIGQKCDQHASPTWQKSPTTFPSDLCEIN